MPASPRVPAARLRGAPRATGDGPSHQTWVGAWGTRRLRAWRRLPKPLGVGEKCNERCRALTNTCLRRFLRALSRPHTLNVAPGLATTRYGGAAADRAVRPRSGSGARMRELHARRPLRLAGGGAAGLSPPRLLARFVPVVCMCPVPLAAARGHGHTHCLQALQFLRLSPAGLVRAIMPAAHTHRKPPGLDAECMHACTRSHACVPVRARATEQVDARFVLRSACAGVIASTALEAFLYPLDTLKTRIQTRQTIQGDDFKEQQAASRLEGVGGGGERKWTGGRCEC